MAQKYKPDTLGKRIKEARQKRHWTQKQLGDKSGINEVQIRGYENGTRTPKIATLEKIAIALEVPLSDLYGNKLDKSYIDFFTGNVDIKKLLDIADGNSNEKPANEAQQGFVDLMKKFKEEMANEASEKLILDQYNKLNDIGKQKAVEYTTDLAQMEKYQRDPGTKK